MAWFTLPLLSACADASGGGDTAAASDTDAAVQLLLDGGVLAAGADRVVLAAADDGAWLAAAVDGGADAVLARLSDDLSVRWALRLPGSYAPTQVLPLPDGAWVLSGEDGTPLALTRVTEDGALVTRQDVLGCGPGRGAVVEDGLVVVDGATAVRLDAAFGVAWARSVAASVVRAVEGGVVLAGVGDVEGRPGVEVTALDMDGAVRWQAAQSPGAASLTVAGVDVLADGRVVAGVGAASYDAAGAPFCLAWFGADGQPAGMDAFGGSVQPAGASLPLQVADGLALAADAAGVWAGMAAGPADGEARYSVLARFEDGRFRGAVTGAGRFTVGNDGSVVGADARGGGLDIQRLDDPATRCADPVTVVGTTRVEAVGVLRDAASARVTEAPAPLLAFVDRPLSPAGLTPSWTCP